MNILTKIGLGTVQFGLNYGVSNKEGKPSINEVKEILLTAINHNINLLDTSFSYGDSQNVLGSIIESENFNVVSKYQENDTSIYNQFNYSLKTLKKNTLYAYLIHHFSFYQKNKNALNQLIQLKKEGKVEKIGFSLNVVSELKYILKNKIPIDLIQVPINIFNQDFVPYLKQAKDNGIEVHARSMFSQGLIFFTEQNLPAFFNPIKNKINYFNESTNSLNCTKIQLASSFLFYNKNIDKIIIGVNNNKQLIENINNINNLKNFSFSTIDYEKFKIEDDLYKTPSNWKI